MGRPVDEIMNQLPEERRNRIIAESERLEVEYQIRQNAVQSRETHTVAVGRDS